MSKHIMAGVIIFVAALLLRWMFLVTYDGGKMLKNTCYAADEFSYDTIAMNVVNGKGFIIDSILARRMPLYPAFLAVVYKITHHSIIAARLIQGILGALVCVLIFCAGEALHNTRTGFIAGVIAAIDYSSIQMSAYLLSEAVYIPLFIASFFFLLKYYRGKRAIYLAACSLTVGLATLTRESAVFLVPIFALWLLWAMEGPIRARIKPILIIAGISALIVLPWSLRNAAIYHRFIPFTVSSGHTLYLGNNEYTVALNGGHETPSIIREDVGNLFTPGADDLLREKAWSFMKAHPRQTLLLACKKFYNMWQPFFVTSKLSGKVSMTMTYIPVVLLGIAGFIRERKDRIAILCIAIIAGYTVMHMFTISGIRYRYPLMPFFIMYASCVIYDVFLARNSSRMERDQL